jgi:hypothetical protein
MDVVIDSASVAVAGPWTFAGLVPSKALSALAAATEQEGLTDWLFVELVGTPPLSERCIFSGGSGVLNEPEESVI